MRVTRSLSSESTKLEKWAHFPNLGPIQSWLQNFEARGKPSTVFPRAGLVETERFASMWKSQLKNSRRMRMDTRNAMPLRTQVLCKAKNLLCTKPTRRWSWFAILKTSCACVSPASPRNTACDRRHCPGSKANLFWKNTVSSSKTSTPPRQSNNHDNQIFNVPVWKTVFLCKMIDLQSMRRN